MFPIFVGKRSQIYYFVFRFLNINKCLSCVQNNKYDLQFF